MTARRSSSRTPQRAQRAPTTWSRFTSTDGAYDVIAASSKVLITSLVLNNAGISETIRRTRGLVSIISDQTSTVETQAGAFGAVVVSDVALAAGVASIPGPLTNRDDDGWLLWVPFFQRGADNGLAENQPYEFDSKAMRRVEDGFSIAFVAENANTGFGLEIGVVISALTSLS